MQISLVVNGHEINYYIAENGIDVTKETRVEKSVIVMDGTLFKKNKEKYNLKLTFLDRLFDDKYTELKSFFFEANPARVIFSNYDTGLHIDDYFYVVDNGYKIKKSWGSGALISGASINLIQR